MPKNIWLAEWNPTFQGSIQWKANDYKSIEVSAGIEHVLGNVPGGRHQQAPRSLAKDGRPPRVGNPGLAFPNGAPKGIFALSITRRIQSPYVVGSRRWCQKLDGGRNTIRLFHGIDTREDKPSQIYRSECSGLNSDEDIAGRRHQQAPIGDVLWLATEPPANGDHHLPSNLRCSACSHVLARVDLVSPSSLLPPRSGLCSSLLRGDDSYRFSQSPWQCLWTQRVASSRQSKSLWWAGYAILHTNFARSVPFCKLATSVPTPGWRIVIPDGLTLGRFRKMEGDRRGYE